MCFVFVLYLNCICIVFVCGGEDALESRFSLIWAARREILGVTDEDKGASEKIGDQSPFPRSSCTAFSSLHHLCQPQLMLLWSEYLSLSPVHWPFFHAVHSIMVCLKWILRNFQWDVSENFILGKFSLMCQHSSPICQVCHQGIRTFEPSRMRKSYTDRKPSGNEIQLCHEHTWWGAYLSPYITLGGKSRFLSSPTKFSLISQPDCREQIVNRKSIVNGQLEISSAFAFTKTRPNQNI